MGSRVLRDGKGGRGDDGRRGVALAVVGGVVIDCDMRGGDSFV